MPLDVVLASSTISACEKVGCQHEFFPECCPRLKVVGVCICFVSLSASLTLSVALSHTDGQKQKKQQTLAASGMPQEGRAHG